MKQQAENRLDKLVADAREVFELREDGYRQRALKLYPWVCGRCAREFNYDNIRELTVHHRDHDHDNNPPDGSNWELLCLYCHDNEHQRLIEQTTTSDQNSTSAATHNPLAGLKAMMSQGNKKD